MTGLWLVRHGQTDWNLTGRWQGQSGNAPGLNDEGRAQVLEVCEKLQRRNITAIYSSDLLRARQTASLIADSLHLTVILEPHLREINLGIWEGMLSEEIKKDYAEELAQRSLHPFQTSAPNGESPHDVSERVLPAINEIAGAHHDENILIVSHAMTLAVIICQAMGFQKEDIYQLVPENAQPYYVQWKSE
jgi:broad specificity phosphatase PhoE